MARKNSLYKARRMKKTLQVVLIIVIFIVCLAPIIVHSQELESRVEPDSKMEWDNILSYEKNDTVAKFTNALGLGGEIGRAELKTPLFLPVIRGENRRVMIYEIQSNDDYWEALGDVKFTDMKTGGQTTRPYHFEYAIYGWVNKTDFYNKCDTNKETGFVSCYGVENGSHLEWEIVEWREFNSKDLRKENITISLVTDVYAGDSIDGIWNVFGKDIDRHAVWNDTLETDLLAYYKMDDGTEDDTDFGHDGIDEGTNDTVGKINDGRGFDGNNDRINISYPPLKYTNQDFTINAWVFYKDSGQPTWEVAGGSSAGYGFYLYTSDSHKHAIGKHAVNEQRATTAKAVLNQWNMVTLVYDQGADQVRFYQNGTPDGSNPYSYSTEFGYNQTWLGWNNGAFSEGIFDEVAFWNRTLSDSEVQQLWNSGSGITRTASDSIPNATLNTPINYYNSTASSFSINCTGADDQKVQNLSLFINGARNYTETGSGNALELFQTITFADGYYNWTCISCDNATITQCAWASSNRSFGVDANAPILNIVFPENQTYAENITTMNYTVFDEHLSVCWYFDGFDTNTTLPCGNNITALNNTEGQSTRAVYANDTFGHLTSAFVTYTQATLGGITITYPPAIDFHNVTTLNYTIEPIASPETCWYSLDNGITNVTITCGNNITGLQSSDGSNTWSVYYNETTSNTFTDSVTFAQISRFSLCNTTNDIIFLNLTFQDETDLTRVNGEIDSSDFDYWWQTGDVEEYSYINNTNATEWNFCYRPAWETVYIDGLISYSLEGYRQRSYSINDQTLTNTTTDLVLYLLSEADSTAFSFQVLSQSESPLSNVYVVANRSIGGTQTIVGNGYTDAAGAVTFWVNDDYEHSFLFVLEGYDTQLIEIFPVATLSPYTLILGTTGGTTLNNTMREITYSVLPSGMEIYNNTNYDFNFTISSTFWNLDEYGFVLYKNGTEIIGGISDTTQAGGTVNLNNNTNISEYIVMNYFWTINGTTTNGTKTWFVSSLSGEAWSLKIFLWFLITFGRYAGFPSLPLQIFLCCVFLLLSNSLLILSCLSFSLHLINSLSLAESFLSEYLSSILLSLSYSCDASFLAFSFLNKFFRTLILLVLKVILQVLHLRLILLK